MTIYLNSTPYPWPYDGDLRPDNTGLIIIDMQTDFCGKGGYVDSMGYDINLTRAPIEPLRKLLPAMRNSSIALYDRQLSTLNTAIEPTTNSALLCRGMAKRSSTQ